MAGPYLSSCVVHYKMNDDAPNTTVIDALGNANGTLVGGDNTENISEAGKINNALHLDGSADFISIDGLLNYISNDTKGSFSFWMYIDSDDNGKHQAFAISRDAGDTFTHLSVFANLFPFGGYKDCLQIQVTIDNFEQWNAATNNESLDPYIGDWLHVMIIHDGSEIKIYFNNSEQNLTWGTSPDKTKWLKDLAEATNPVDTANIGVQEKGGKDFNHIDGLIDDFRYYSNYVLTSSERSALYNSGNGTENGVGPGHKELGLLNTELEMGSKYSIGNFNGELQ